MIYIGTRILGGLSVIATLVVMMGVWTPPAHAQSDDNASPEDIANMIPARILSVVSGGRWEGKIEVKTGSGDSEKTEEMEARGYYRILAIRSADNTSRLYLQRIRLSDSGPVPVDTTEITTLTEMNAYITDMRPESSTGIALEPGFAAFVYLKLDPATEEPDTYELFVDDFGDWDFALATN